MVEREREEWNWGSHPPAGLRGANQGENVPVTQIRGVLSTKQSPHPSTLNGESTGKMAGKIAIFWHKKGRRPGKKSDSAALGSSHTYQKHQDNSFFDIFNFGSYVRAPVGLLASPEGREWSFGEVLRKFQIRWIRPGTNDNKGVDGGDGELHRN
eukprot:EG_transcript_19751